MQTYKNYLKEVISEKIKKEDAPTNAAGSGAVAGVGVGAYGEPGVKKKKKQFKEFNRSPLVEFDENFSVDDPQMDKDIKKSIKAPFVNTKKSTLGGAPSLAIHISLDDKSSWNNNIFQNSRHGTFMLHSDKQSIDLITKHHKLPKFRKGKFKSVKDIIAKINKWIDSAKSVKEEVELDEAVDKNVARMSHLRVRPSTKASRAARMKHWPHSMNAVAFELQLYIEKDSQLYKSQLIPIVKNMQRKMKSGKYDHKKSPKLWMYIVDAGAKKYVKDHGSPGDKVNDMFPKKTREFVAQRMADEYKSEIESQDGVMFEEVELDEGKMKELSMEVDAVVAKMKKHRDMKGFADKFKKDVAKSMNISKSLEKVLPDYIAGSEIQKLVAVPDVVRRLRKEVEEVELNEGKFDKLEKKLGGRIHPAALEKVISGKIKLNPAEKKEFDMFMNDLKKLVGEELDLIEEAKYSSGKVQKAFRSPNSYKLAKQLVNYKKNDEGWAMFRMKMHSMLQAMGTDIAKTGEISKKTKKEYGHYYDGKSLDWYQKVIQQWIVEFKKNLLDEATKWKIGDGRPRGGSHIENVRFWDLPKDQLQYIMKDADKAVKANPTARKATSGPGNWADQINDADTVLAWRKKNGIKEEVARLKEGKKNVFGENDSFAGGIIFDVDEDTFRNSRMGRNRYERWRRFVNVESEMGRTIREFHRKHSSVPIILRNEIGAMFYLKK